MVTDIQIINMALGHVGVSQFIESRSENTTPAEVANEYYDPALEWAMEQHAFGFTRAFRALGLVEEDPTTFWRYSYRYPDDCVKVRALVTVLGPDNPTPPHFVIGADEAGRLIYTNEEEATAEYSRLVTDTRLFPAMFSMAMSWWLGGLMCPALSKDSKIADNAFQKAMLFMNMAAVSDANEAQNPPEGDSEFTRERG